MTRPPQSEVPGLWNPPDNAPWCEAPDGRVWCMSAWDTPFWIDVGLFLYVERQGKKTWGLHGEPFLRGYKGSQGAPLLDQIDAMGGREMFMLRWREWVEERLAHEYGSPERLTYGAATSDGELLPLILADAGAWQLDVFSRDPVIVIGNALPK